jgi:inositol hexakisphosphate/diphosphoinositol-pentakisphosphate kinase
LNIFHIYQLHILSFQSLVEDWPLCDCFLAFHSTGFPVEKAIAYAKLRKPYIVNNLEIQYDIQDRRRVYQILEEAGIEIPSYAILDRDDPTSKFIKQQ